MLMSFFKSATHARRHTAIVASVILFLFAYLPLCVQAIPFTAISKLVFFGDSLSDSGFNDLWPTEGAPPHFPALPTNKAPTFTTLGGYTWSQYLARDIKGVILPVYPGPTPADTITNNSFYAGAPVLGFVSGTLNGFNYAAGGSTTNAAGVGEAWAPSLHQQVTTYLNSQGPVLDPNAVYFIWEGANDLLALLLGSTLPTQEQLLAASNAAALNIAGEVGRLAARGAKRVVVLSLPNIGITPLINGVALQENMPTLPAQMQIATFTFNSMLNSTLGAVIAQTGIKVLYVDVYKLLDQVVTATQKGLPYVVAGEAFQFVNYTTPACGAAPSAIYCGIGTPTGYVFADTLHPTDMAHRLLSLQVETLLMNWK